MGNEVSAKEILLIILKAMILSGLFVYKINLTILYVIFERITEKA